MHVFDLQSLSSSWLSGHWNEPVVLLPPFFPLPEADDPTTLELPPIMIRGQAIPASNPPIELPAELPAEDPPAPDEPAEEPVRQAELPTPEVPEAGSLPFCDPGQKPQLVIGRGFPPGFGEGSVHPESVRNA